MRFRVRRLFIDIFLVFLLINLGIHNAEAWNDKQSHKDISQFAVGSMASISLDRYVKDKIGYEEGMDVQVGEDDLMVFIRYGSQLEDGREPDGAYRAKNHFHDPTRPFDKAGLNNPNFMMDGFGQSAALWGESGRENVWTLEDFYDYLYGSFTAANAEARKGMLADAFRTAGHLMHLLEDMAVPAHVRNELLVGHTLKRIRDWPPFSSPIESYLFHNPGYINSVPPGSVPSFETYLDHFDTGYYRENSGQPVSGATVGLAEYTNSNFFSEFQFFYNYEHAAAYPYPNPDLRDVYFWDERIDTARNYAHLAKVLPATFYSAYAGRQSADPDRNIAHLARVGFFWKYQIAPEGLGAIFLDEACHIDYLTKLVPKAVAYVSGLLEFLFRGDIDFTLDLANLTIGITNNSEKTMDGVFDIYYDNQDGFRERLPETMSLVIAPGETVTSPLSITALPRDLGIEKVFTVAFRGTLGLVEGVVTGKTTKLAPWEFYTHNSVEYRELQYPEVNENFYATGPGTGTNTLTYGCRFGFDDALSDQTVMKGTNFALGVIAVPEILKKLGYKEGERAWFNIETGSYGNPGLVDYFKVSPARGEWKYLHDSSGANSVEGGGTVSYPAGYSEGLWTYETGYYMDEFHKLWGIENPIGQCTPEVWTDGGPYVNIALLYSVADHIPECPNAEDMLATGRAYCASYGNFYNQTLSANAPYLPLMYDGSWKDYGFELRLNRLVARSPKRGDGVIYDGPVTFTKDYGSTDLIVH